MPVRIQFRLGDVVPINEYLDVGEPLFDPAKNRLGLGSGNAQPSWYPGIDPISQDMVMFGSSMLRSESGGKAARAGWEGKDTFAFYTFSGLRIRVTDLATNFYNKVNLNAGGTLSGDVNTDGGRFTDMNIQKITVSALTDEIVIESGDDASRIGVINHDGISSKSQQNAYIAMAGWVESQQALMRNMFSSGLVATRGYTQGRPFDPMFKQALGNFAALGIHSHPSWQGMCGLGELSALVNGYHIQTRHVDYRLMRPVRSFTFADRALNTGVPMPAEVTARGSGYTGVSLNANLANSQVAWMRDVYTAAPSDCIYELAYLECWVEKFDGNIQDIASSGRYGEAELRSFKEQFDEAMFYAQSGMKPPNEINQILPGVVMSYDKAGMPVLGYINWRVSAVPVANAGPYNRNLIMDGVGYDLRGLPFVPEKAGKGVLDSTNRFKVRRIQPHRWFSNGSGRNEHDDAAPDILQPAVALRWVDLIRQRTTTLFDVEDLEDLCRMCPGLDGAQNFDTQYIDDPNGATVPGTRAGVRYSAPGDRGLYYYNNYFNSSVADASGFNQLARGFADMNLFTAKTDKEEVLGGWTFMIPLELVLRTPRENWNPLNVPKVGVLTGDGSYQRPYNGWHPEGAFYTIPVDSLIGQETPTTPADTRDRAWVLTPSGVKEMYASGVRTFDFTGERRRFPLAVEASQFSSSGRDLEWLKFTMKQMLKRVASGENLTGDEIDEAF